MVISQHFLPPLDSAVLLKRKHLGTVEYEAPNQTRFSDSAVILKRRLPGTKECSAWLIVLMKAPGKEELTRDSKQICSLWI